MEDSKTRDENAGSVRHPMEFLKPDWKKRDPRKRVEALRRRKDRNIATELAENDPDENVRAVAVTQCTSEIGLRILRNDVSRKVKKAALAMVDNTGGLVDVLMAGELPELAGRVAKRIRALTSNLGLAVRDLGSNDDNRVEKAKRSVAQDGRHAIAWLEKALEPQWQKENWYWLEADSASEAVIQFLDKQNWKPRSLDLRINYALSARDFAMLIESADVTSLSKMLCAKQHVASRSLIIRGLCHLSGPQAVLAQLQPLFNDDRSDTWEALLIAAKEDPRAEVLDLLVDNLDVPAVYWGILDVGTEVICSRIQERLLDDRAIDFETWESWSQRLLSQDGFLKHPGSLPTLVQLAENKTIPHAPWSIVWTALKKRGMLSREDPHFVPLALHAGDYSAVADITPNVAATEIAKTARLSPVFFDKNMRENLAEVWPILRDDVSLFPSAEDHLLLALLVGDIPMVASESATGTVLEHVPDIEYRDPYSAQFMRTLLEVDEPAAVSSIIYLLEKSPQAAKSLHLGTEAKLEKRLASHCSALSVDQLEFLARISYTETWTQRDVVHVDPLDGTEYHNETVQTKRKTLPEIRSVAQRELERRGGATHT